MRTSASRETQIALTSWLATVGICTDGRLDAAGGFTQGPGVAHVILQPTLSNAQ